MDSRITHTHSSSKWEVPQTLTKENSLPMSHPTTEMAAPPTTLRTLLQPSSDGTRDQMISFIPVYILSSQNPSTIFPDSFPQQLDKHIFPSTEVPEALVALGTSPPLPETTVSNLSWMSHRVSLEAGCHFDDAMIPWSPPPTTHVCIYAAVFIIQ